MSKIKTKYGGLLEWEIYRSQLVKNIFKILPLMEEKKDWKKFLAGLLSELAGLDDLSVNADFTTVCAKLNGLFFLDKESIKDGMFKKVVFDTIDVVKKIKID